MNIAWKKEAFREHWRSIVEYATRREKREIKLACCGFLIYIKYSLSYIVSCKSSFYYVCLQMIQAYKFVDIRKDQEHNGRTISYNGLV